MMLISVVLPGVIGGEYNGKVTGKFADLAEKALGVSKNRFYIKVGAISGSHQD